MRTRATKVEGGWTVTGTKVWTSEAHVNHFFAVLCRTSPMEEGKKHAGLSQLIVDLHADGVTISPIPFLDGSHHFNEVALEDVFVPDDMVLGEIGSGWQQVTSELAYERSGPDRWLSTFTVLREFLREGGKAAPTRRRRSSGASPRGSGRSGRCRCRSPGPSTPGRRRRSRRRW